MHGSAFAIGAAMPVKANTPADIIDVKPRLRIVLRMLDIEALQVLGFRRLCRSLRLGTAISRMRRHSARELPDGLTKIL